MQLKYSLFPYASLEGVPVIVVSETTDGWKSLDVASVLRQAWRPGYRGIVFGSDAPWGEDGWDQALHRAMSTPELAELEFVGVRKLGDAGWSRLRLSWVIDASSLLEAPTSAALIRTDILRVPYYPRPIEVIVRNPDPANISPPVLDEVHEQLRPEYGCYLYVEDDLKGDALDASMRLIYPKLGSFWTSRRITRAHAMNDQSWEANGNV